MPPNPQQRSGRRRPRSRYGTQLHEKQELKKIFGIRDGQLRNYYREARGASAETGNHMIQLLEQRLDNVIFRAGFAETRQQSRQFATHRLFTVNDRPVDVPSYRVRAGDVIAVKESKRGKAVFANFEKKMQNARLPEWLELDSKGFAVRVTQLPSAEGANIGVDMQAVVELFAR